MSQCQGQASHRFSTPTAPLMAATATEPLRTGVLGVPVSVDTRKPEVAEEALKLGAHLLNDVTGLRDERMVALAARQIGKKVDQIRCVIRGLRQPALLDGLSPGPSAARHCHRARPQTHAVGHASSAIVAISNLFPDGHPSDRHVAVD